MKVSELKELLNTVSDSDTVRIKVGTEYHNLEDVIKGRFFGTIELLAPQNISIEQAEGELYSSYFYLFNRVELKN